MIMHTLFGISLVLHMLKLSADQGFETFNALDRKSWVFPVVKYPPTSNVDRVGQACAPFML